MDSTVEYLWQCYLKAEHTCLRSKAALALDHFITALLALPDNEWQSWALMIIRTVVDERKDIPVRFPFFQRVILPPLAEGVRKRQPGCARWMAFFGDLLNECPEAKDHLPAHLRTQRDLLKEALLLDPHDEIARKHLIDIDASYLEYSTHELPAGVLYEANAATAAECEELCALLVDFVEQVKLAGLYDRYQGQIKKCTFHFIHYRNYLLAGCPSGSYEDYLLQL